MTDMTLGGRNLLAQDTELTPLLGRSASWPTWIFDQKPLFVVLENSQKAWVVLNEGTSTMSASGTGRSRRLLVDIWADPTRNEDHSVRIWDADDKIQAIHDAINVHFHTPNLDVPPNAPDWWGQKHAPRIWGTAEEIASRTGFRCLGSQQIEGPDYRDVRDGNGARMAQLVYSVDTF